MSHHPMPIHLPPIDYQALGIPYPGEVAVETLRERPGHAVYRLSAGGRSFILKTFTTSAKEVRIYALLETLGVPTLPVLARGETFLLLDDLDCSPEWRLAREEDMRLPEVGAAVGAWYRSLHQAGFRTLALPGSQGEDLRSWVDAFDETVLAEAGSRLGLEGIRGWEEGIRQLGRLKEMYRAFPQTFNYTDFAAENLALSRSQPLRAVVFDYDCFATGAVYSDYRNVVGSLEWPAQEAFREAYGPVDAGEEPVDSVLALLEGIAVAAQREKFPPWAKELVEMVQNGAFERQLQPVIG